MKPRSVLLIALLFLGACSSGKKQETPKQFDQLKLTYKNAGQTTQRQIPIVVALVDSTSMTLDEVDGSRSSFAQHSLCLANYDLSEKPEKPNVNATKDVPPGADIAPVKACININGKEGSNAATSLQPGTYEVGLSRHVTNRISSAGIFWDKGKLGSSAVLNLANMRGSLKVDSVSDDMVSGVVDLNDGDNSIAGTFKVKALIKKKIVPPMN